MQRAQGNEQLRAWFPHGSRRAQSNTEPARDDVPLSVIDPWSEPEPPQGTLEEAVLVAIILVAISILLLT